MNEGIERTSADGCQLGVRSSGSHIWMSTSVMAEIENRSNADDDIRF